MHTVYLGVSRIQALFHCSSYHCPVELFISNTFPSVKVHTTVVHIALHVLRVPMHYLLLCSIVISPAHLRNLQKVELETKK